MDWLEDVNGRLRKRRAVLFSRDNPLIAEVTAALQTQGRRTVVLWALDLAAEMAAELVRRLPGEGRPVQALLASAAWARGQVPMAVARRAFWPATAWPGSWTTRPPSPSATPWGRPAPSSTPWATAPAAPCTS